jgi:hypothetical protein
MATGKYLSLEEARKKKRLDRFAKEQPSKGDKGMFNELLDRMAKGEPPKSSPKGGRT